MTLCNELRECPWQSWHVSSFGASEWEGVTRAWGSPITNPKPYSYRPQIYPHMWCLFIWFYMFCYHVLAPVWNIPKQWFSGGCLIVCPLVVKHGLLENSKFIDNFPIKTPFRVDFTWFSSFSCLMTPFRVRRTTWNHPHLQGQGLAQGICEFDCSILLNVWWRLRQLELAMWAMEQTQWTYHGKWEGWDCHEYAWIIMHIHAPSWIGWFWRFMVAIMFHPIPEGC